MPTVGIGRDRLFEALGRTYSQEEFEDLRFKFGIELDDVALPPSDVNFVPLKQVKNFRADELMEFYKSDLKLKKFLHIIESSSVYPVLYDCNRTVLSLPPIINGAHSAITLKTKNVFIECTATDLTKANVVLNTMFEVEPVEVIYSDGRSCVYPDISLYQMEVPLSYITDIVGVPLEENEVASLLNKMQLHAAKSLSEDKRCTFTVSVPPTRSDILHPCDVAEDVVIAYGYKEIPKRIPASLNSLPLNQFSDLIKSQGGKDHASAWYIYTRLSPITRFLFPKDDDILLDYLNEDGQSIEPTWYMPIIPMVLVNGSEGIGTGWSSYIPNYSPRDIAANVRHLLNGEPMEAMDPWYKGFRGTIEKTSTEEAGVSYTVTGIIEEINDTTLRISELPIRRWTQDYKEFLESMLTGNDKIKDPFIKDYREHSDDTTVHFEVILSEENLTVAKQEGLLKKFKLTTTISTSNMHLFDPQGVIKKYDTPEQILEDFFHLRLEFYEKRKKVLLDNLELELLKLDNKVRFILEIVKGEIIVSNRKRAELFIELRDKGFTPFPKKTKTVDAAVAGVATDDAEEPEDNSEVVAGSKGVRASDYEYFLAMAIGSLTLEKVQELLADRDKLSGEDDELSKATPKSLWIKDLDALERELDAARKKMKSRVMGEAGLKATTRQAPKNPRKNNKKTDNTEAVFEAMEISTSAMETDKVQEVVKPKGRGGPKKAPARKAKVSSILRDEEDDDDEVLELKDRLASYNLDSSPDHSEAMGTEVHGAQARKKAPSRKAGAVAQKKNLLTVTEISDNEEENETSDEDFELQEVDEAEVGKKKGGRKAKAAAATASANAAKPAARKRGPATKQITGQKLITEVLKPLERMGISPEKKVRESPFNKKSGSVLGKIGKEDGKNISIESEESAEDTSEVLAPKVLPRRMNRGKATYVVSESESDPVTDDSDFDGDED